MFLTCAIACMKGHMKMALVKCDIIFWWLAVGLYICLRGLTVVCLPVLAITVIVLLWAKEAAKLCLRGLGLQWL